MVTCLNYIAWCSGLSDIFEFDYESERDAFADAQRRFYGMKSEVSLVVTVLREDSQSCLEEFIGCFTRHGGSVTFIKSRAL